MDEQKLTLKKKLSIPKEPEELKKETKELINGERRFAPFFLIKLSSYLWREWKEILVAESYTWNKFLRSVSLIKDKIGMWILEEITWAEFVEKIKEILESPYGRLLLDYIFEKRR